MSSNLPRVTQKIFAENAGDNIGQFGSALSGTANRTGDIEAIQALPAWGQGWAGAVISERDYPPLEEMTGVQKVASQQIAYLLQKGFPEWDEGTTYFANTSFCQVNGVVYKSLTDNNIGNNPTTDTTNWETWKPLEGTYANIDLSNLSEIGNSHFATPDLSNLSATGLDKINQSKALETGNVSSDKDVYADVLKYAHSTFDASKFTVVGTPTITDDGIASGFTARKSYVYIPCDLSSAESWRIRIRQKFIDGNTSCPVSFCSALNNTSEIFRLQFNNVNQRLIVIGDTPHTILKQFPDLNTYYDFEISYNGSEMSVETFKNGISVQKETFEQENIFNVNGYIVIGGSLEANTANAQNLIDLKYFLAKKDYMPFLSGNKTGTYEYKQENQEKAGIVVSIPYTESKTGSMIVDVAYRDRVRDMYEQYGYAPFYTIDEDNKNFTLPMGELYGMIEKTIQTVTSVGRPIFCLNGETLGNNEIWLEGAEVSKAAYSELYAVYGDTYGEPVDQNNFVLPDFRGRSIWGSEDGTYGLLPAGLPNIKGRLGTTGRGSLFWAVECGGADGAFYSNWRGGVMIVAAEGKIETAYDQGYLDVNRYNSIYSDDINTVQPPSIKVRVKTRYK